MKRLGASIASLWRSWVALFSHRESAFGWSVFRIGVGFCVLYALTSIASANLVDLLWVDIEYGGYAKTRPVRILLVELGPATPRLVNAVFVVTYVGALAVFVGIGGRLVTFVTLQGYMCLTSINGATTDSGDSLITNALWLLVLCDATRTLSVRCRLRHGSWTQPAEVGAWARYLAVFQLLVVYTFAGLNKTNTHWVPWGKLNALYRVWMDPVWRRFDMDWVAYIYPLTQFGSAVTWVFEVCSCLMLLVFYFRYTRARPGRVRAAFNRWDLRKLFLVVGMSLHLGIFATMDVGPFSLISLSFYVCLFEPTEAESLFRRTLGRVLAARTEAAPASVA